MQLQGYEPWFQSLRKNSIINFQQCWYNKIISNHHCHSFFFCLWKNRFSIYIYIFWSFAQILALISTTIMYTLCISDSNMKYKFNCIVKCNITANSFQLKTNLDHFEELVSIFITYQSVIENSIYFMNP